MKRDPSLPVVGAESLCATCRHGKMVTVRAEPHPAQLHTFAQENPGKEPPPAIYHVMGYCTAEAFVGRRGRNGARGMGTVVDCEVYEGRES